MPAVELGTIPVEGPLLLGSFHRNQKPLHTRCHIHTGKEGFSTGDGKPSGVLFFAGTTGKERRPGELGQHRKGRQPGLLFEGTVLCGRP